MRKVVCLQFQDYEMEINHYFLEPENALDLKTLCDSLLDEAVEKTCKAAREEAFGGTWVGWMNIVETLSDMLPSHGYERVIIPTVGYFGSTIINNREDVLGDGRTEQMSEKSLNAVIEHNRVIRKKYDRPKPYDKDEISKLLGDSSDLLNQYGKESQEFTAFMEKHKDNKELISLVNGAISLRNRIDLLRKECE